MYYIYNIIYNTYNCMVRYVYKILVKKQKISLFCNKILTLLSPI